MSYAGRGSSAADDYRAHERQQLVFDGQAFDGEGDAGGEAGVEVDAEVVQMDARVVGVDGLSTRAEALASIPVES